VGLERLLEVAALEQMVLARNLEDISLLYQQL
jgi:hypothetical protein